MAIVSASTRAADDDETASGADANSVVVVAPHGAHLREFPGVHKRILGKLGNGSGVIVTGPMQGNWVPVRADGVEGFIFKSLLMDSKTGKTLNRATEGDVICNGDGCESRHKTVFQRNLESMQEISAKVAPKRKKHKAVEPASEPDENEKPKRVSGGKGQVPHGAAIDRALRAGLSAPRNYCALAVWKILLAAHLVHGDPKHSGANAKDMGPILRRNGFISDPKACLRPDVVRIYGPNRCGHSFRNPMAGDKAGHIEILGMDRRYHSFFSSPESIQQHLGETSHCFQRRPLQSCWYKP